MRFFYLDPGLIDNHGHHANVCRAIVRETRRRGIDTTVFGYERMIPRLQEELSARPHFRRWSYATFADPICGWFKNYELSEAAFREDVAVLATLGPSDLVYLNSALPAHFMGLANWLQTRDAQTLPHIFVEFGHEPGVDPQHWPPQQAYAVRDPRIDPRAAFYRAAALNVPAAARSRLHPGSFEQRCSALFAKLLGLDFAVFPLPHVTPETHRTRAGTRPVTVAMLGTQRREKGFHLVPDIVRGLLAADAPLRCLVHNSAADWMRAQRRELHAIAAREPRLILEESDADAVEWDRLLDRVDLVLCPYEPVRYHASYSAVAVEAVARGIPIVGPAWSSMDRLIREYHDCGTMFEAFTVESIVDATLRAVREFDALAARAHQAADAWAPRHTAARLVDGLLGLARGSSAPEITAPPPDLVAGIEIVSTVQPPPTF